MGLLDKLKKEARKKKLEIKQERLANEIIKKKARAAGLRAREKEAIKLAEFKEQQKFKKKKQKFFINKPPVLFGMQPQQPTKIKKKRKKKKTLSDIDNFFRY